MAMRLSGMISGLDTDSIVQELISAYSTKKDNIVKAQTKLSWKQDVWKELNTKIYHLYSKTLSDLRFTYTLNKKKTIVSDANKALVTGGNEAVNGTQTLEIKSLAKTGYLTGDKLTIGNGSTKITGTTTLSELGLPLPSSFEITTNGEVKEIALSADMTINELVFSLNKTGVNANFDTVNQRFFINSSTSGASGDFTFSASTPEGTTALSELGFTSAGAIKIDAQDAKIVLNGATFTSASNSFSINGLIINALGVTSDEITITTDTDNEGTYDTIKNFIKEYNTLIIEMDSLYNAASSKGYSPLTEKEKESMTEAEIEKWEEKIKSSLLRRDGTVSSLTSAMKNFMAKGFVINGKMYSLSTFGINTLDYFKAADNENGAYHIDGDSEDSSTSGKANKLKRAIATDPEGVTSFFTQFAKGLYDELGKKMQRTSLRSIYKVYNDKQLSDEYDDYSKQIKMWEEKIEKMEESYYQKFAAMEKALSTLQSQTSALSGLLGTK